MVALAPSARPALRSVLQSYHSLRFACCEDADDDDMLRLQTFAVVWGDSGTKPWHVHRYNAVRQVHGRRLVPAYFCILYLVTMYMHNSRRNHMRIRFNGWWRMRCSESPPLSCLSSLPHRIAPVASPILLASRKGNNTQPHSIAAARTRPGRPDLPCLVEGLVEVCLASKHMQGSTLAFRNRRAASPSIPVAQLPTTNNCIY